MGRDWLRSDQRALSPVVGGALLLAIAVVLVSLTAVMILGTADETPPAPTSNFEIEQTDSGGYVLELTGGDDIDGDRLTIRGIENPDVLDGREFEPGDSVSITPTGEEITIVWNEAASDGVSYQLREFTVDPAVASPIAPFPSGTVFTGDGSDLIQITGDGGTVTTLYSGPSVSALGQPGGDVTGDGETNLAFVTDGGTVYAVDADGSATTVAEDADVPGSIGTDKTRLAIGRWNGSATSVFFVDQNHDTIYRATPGGSPVAVATPGDGAQSVVGDADIDADGDRELLFGDASQTLQYLEPNGSVQTTGVSTGSSTGIGTGSVADFDGDGRPEVGVVDGGNDIQFVDASGGSKVTSGDVSAASAPTARQSPTAAGDVDGDDETELIYVGTGSDKLKYLDNIGGTIDIEYLTDEDGNRIDGSSATGTT